jgi:basic membrane protein A
MAVRRRTFAADGTILDVVDAVYDARRYAYEAEIRRSSGPVSDDHPQTSRENDNVSHANGERVSALVLGLGAMSTALAADKPIALIIAQGGLGDQSYNDLAYAGFKKAIAEAKLEGKPVESKDVVAQAADILRRASDAGFGLVVDLEYSHGDALATVAKDYAGTDYVILNQVKPGANVASVLFQEQEGSYLAALVATDKSIKGIYGKPVIGVIAGAKSVVIDKFIVGYIQGARDIDPNVEVKVDYSNNFGDPAIGLQMAKAV